jgi:hypothetical protein
MKGNLVPAVLGLVLAVVLGSTLRAEAQVEVKATTTTTGTRQFEVVAPGPPRDATRPREADFYREDVRVRHEPAFIEPLSSRTPGARIKKTGVSGWTAPPGLGAGAIEREEGGWFALGITFVWD